MLSVLIVLLSCGLAVPAEDYTWLNNVQTETDLTSQMSAVTDMIHRLIPDKAHYFVIVIDPAIGPPHRDTFKLQTISGRLSITATSGVAAGWGFYYYLSQYCNCHISWAGDQLSLPDTLPEIAKPGVIITSNDRFRYYQNVCTVSYSFVWWNWTRWEREIDWMVMNGINLPLAFNAQEAIWQRVYMKMGLTKEELDRHFGGAAFLAWSRMGNIKGWGGPLSNSWHENQVALQHKILDRMRQFGITPVLPAFAGHIPQAITRLYPNVTYSKLPRWPGNAFNATYSGTYLLDVDDPLFPVIGKSFITEYTKEFGTNHIYNTDTFNEMTPKSSSPAYLKSAGRAVYNAMLAGDPQAVWLMQGWLFLNTGFWKEPQVKALLTSVPKGRMIVLDLFSEVTSLYDRFQSYYGQPFIWCMLHDFGGTVAMYGAVESVNTGPFKGRAFPNSSMVGIGLTPEGINQNNVIYEFMMENSWRTRPRNIPAWASNYAVRRYGKSNKYTETAWKIFMASVYNCTTGHSDNGNNVIVRTPQLSFPVAQSVWYNPEEFFQGWDNMIKASYHNGGSDLFRYDLVDVTRQSLQLIAIHTYTQLVTAYKQRNITSLRSSGKSMLSLFTDLEELLASDPHFLLGKWIEDAKASAESQTDKQLYEYNARIQVTMWGPNAEILDYANKQWSGLVHSYYKPRWQLFIMELEKSLQKGTPFNQATFNIDAFKLVEEPFTKDRTHYPTTPSGKQIEVSQFLYNKYRAGTREQRKFYRRLPQWSTKGKRFIKHASKWMRYNNVQSI